MITSKEFGKRLKHILKERGLSQRDICRLTGISPAQISYYVNGFSIPNEENRINLINALSLPEDFFQVTSVEKDKKANTPPEKKSSDTMSVEEAAWYLHKAPTYVRLGLQQERFPWGYAVQTSKNRWSYWIGRKKFFQETQLEEK